MTMRRYIDQKKPPKKRFPLSYIAHLMQIYGMEPIKASVVGRKVFFYAGLPEGCEKNHFIGVVLHRWRNAEITWTDSGLAIDLTHTEYIPAKGSWSYEQMKRRDARERKWEEQAFATERRRKHTEDTPSREKAAVRTDAVLYREDSDGVRVQVPQADGRRDPDVPGGGEQC